MHSITRQRSGLQKIVAVIDSIASNPGVLLPWKEMVVICKEEGVMSIIDGAHSIGQELDINLGLAQPDFWVSVSTRTTTINVAVFSVMFRTAINGYSGSVPQLSCTFQNGETQISSVSTKL